MARAVLRGFRDRGYKDDARIWALWRQRYPEVDLELEVFKLAEWLREPRNEKRKCSKGFLDNWFSRAAADLVRRTVAEINTPIPVASPVVGTNSALNGGLLLSGSGVYHSPASRQRNPNPEAALPSWGEEEARRSDAAREQVRERLPWRRRSPG